MCLNGAGTGLKVFQAGIKMVLVCRGAMTGLAGVANARSTIVANILRTTMTTEEVSVLCVLQKTTKICKSCK